MGHGGTLDPMATGVLIVGIGRGTKHLGDMLGCIKTYETIVLFGKGTDTYDVAGKIVSEAPFDQISRSMVEQKLDTFYGKIKQVPPIYSALKVAGMKAYEYARSGKELPRDLESRDMNVEECVLMDWYEGGQHNYRWPAVEANEEEKSAVRKLMEGVQSISETNGNDATEVPVLPEEQTDKATRTRERPRMSIAEMNKLTPSAKAALHTHEQNLSDNPADGPAVKVRLTVSSGFYVRSFAHDLGIACGSFGTMAELVRTRQGDFSCDDPPEAGLIPCITYQELEEGEDIWGPKLSEVLGNWVQKNPIISNSEKTDDRDKPTLARSSFEPVKSDRYSGRESYRPQQNHFGNKRKRRDGDSYSRYRRNSSSPE